MGSSQFLVELPNKTLAGMSSLASLSIVMMLLLPLFLWLVERRLPAAQSLAPVPQVH
jgi:hypothetical protein